MAEYDAVGAVLQRAAENGMAARHVLGDQTTGLKYARMLVSDSWHTPGYDPGPFLSSYVHPGGVLPPIGQVDLSAPTAAFLKAAVSAERGTSADAKESAWSVVHIVQATAEFSKLHPGTHLPEEIRGSLLYVAGRYLPDFAQSVNHNFASGALQQGNKSTNPWVPINKLDELEGFFTQALQKPEEFGAFKGLMASRVSVAVAATIHDPSDRNYLREMGGLFGLIQRVENTHHFEGELRVDEEAAKNQMLLATASGGFGALSFSNPFGPGTMAQIFTALGTPALNEAFDTGHALKALKANMDASRHQVFQVEVPVVQGLVDAGAVHPRPNASWVSNGRVIPNAALVDWISLHADTRYAGRSLTDWITEAQTAMRMQQ